MTPSLEERMHRNAYISLQNLRGRPVGPYIKVLQKWQQLDRRQFNELMHKRLLESLSYARAHVPLYASPAWSMADPRDLTTWPVLERHALKEQHRELHSRRLHPGMNYRHSSSSTGEPVHVAFNPQAAAWSWATEYRAMLWYGVEPGARTLVMWGRQSPLLDWIKNHRIFNARDLTTAELDAAAKYLLHKHVSLCSGLPSAIAELGRYVRAHYPDAPKQLATFARVGGEQVYPFQREEIARHLGARTIDFYGCTEVGAVAAECPEGSMHIASEHVYIEIFRDGAPVPPGEFGDIVATSLVNRAMPLVRCRIGDRGSMSFEPCRCGRPHPILTDLVGRAADLFLTADGSKVHGTVLGNALSPLLATVHPRAVRQVLFEQADPLHWRILVESSDGFDDQLASSLADIVHTNFGRKCNVRVERVPCIPREPSGKFRYYRPGVRVNNQAAAGPMAS